MRWQAHIDGDEPIRIEDGDYHRLAGDAVTVGATALEAELSEFRKACRQLPPLATADAQAAVDKLRHVLGQTGEAFQTIVAEKRQSA